MNIKKKAVAYARVSSGKQSETSIEAQLEAIQHLAKTHNLEIIKTYTEKVTATGEKDRPEFNKMIEEAETGTFDFILVYKSDRFYRYPLEEQLLREELKKKGIYVISSADFADTSTPAGKFQSWIFSGLNGWYIDNMKQELYTKNTTVAKRGFFMGGTPPYGYSTQEIRDKEASRNRKIYTINDKEAPIVKIIFDMALKGESTGQIAKYLNENKVPTRKGGKWSNTTLYDILHNKKYMGTFTYRVGTKHNSHKAREDTIEVDNAIPPIIDSETFEAIQKRYTGRRKKQGNVKHLLSGFLTCGICGAQMVLAGSGKGYYKYECGRYKRYRDTMYLSVGETKAEKEIIGFINTILSETDYEIVANSYNKQMALLDVQNKDRVIILQNEIKKIEQQIDNALNSILEGVAPERMKEKISRLEEDKINYSRELAEMSGGNANKISAKEVKEFYEEYMRKLYGSFEEKREIIRTFIEEIKIYPQGYVKIVPRDRSV